MSRKRQRSTQTGAVVTTRSRAERRRQEREERRRSRAPQLVVLVMIVVALGVASAYPAKQLVARLAVGFEVSQQAMEIRLGARRILSPLIVEGG